MGYTEYLRRRQRIVRCMLQTSIVRGLQDV
jgi:hypothetical protein